MACCYFNVLGSQGAVTSTAEASVSHAEEKKANKEHIVVDVPREDLDRARVSRRESETQWQGKVMSD